MAGRPRHLGCAFMWSDVGDIMHQCAVRGEHDMHLCNEEDCEEQVPFDVAGGRWPVPHTGSKARKSALT